VLAVLRGSVSLHAATVAQAADGQKAKSVGRMPCTIRARRAREPDSPRQQG
jgi:hypothetical protein